MKFLYSFNEVGIQAKGQNHMLVYFVFCQSEPKLKKVILDSYFFFQEVPF